MSSTTLFRTLLKRGPNLKAGVFSTFIFTLLFTLVGPSVAVQAAETTLTKAQDLANDAREAQRLGVPILILYSLPGCPYCEAIRRSHLTPMNEASNKAQAPRRAIIRQVDLKSSLGLIDFEGQRVSHASFAQAQNIKFAPVVAFYGKDAKPLTDPLIGTMLPDFYGQYLDDALTTATFKLGTSNTSK